MAQEIMSAKKVWESVELYTIRCTKCSKWRLIPTKEKYEEMRERIVEQSFQCETAREWRPDVSCEDASDVKQDSSLLWAMDRPSIPQTPPGWQRIIRIRAEGGKKFADVYYVAPSNKRFRSMVELDRYLIEHPQEGVSVSRFSFQAPVPLDANYVAKRQACSTSSCGIGAIPVAVDHISRIAPYDNMNLHSGRPKSETTEVEAPAES